jgi:hypothetical protein
MDVGSAICGADYLSFEPGDGYQSKASVDLEGNVVEPKRDPTLDADIQISPDWQTIREYTAKGSFNSKISGWSYKRYCLRNGKYLACGSGPSGPPPEPRNRVR